MHRRSILISGVVLLGLACGQDQMLPARTAKVVPGAPSWGVAQENGVRIAATGDRDTARSTEHTRWIRPVRVRIVNHSGKPVRVVYQQFELAGVGGRAYHPVPVVPADHQSGGSTRFVLRPMFAAANFFVGPLYRDVYPSLPPWSQPLSGDRAFHNRQYELWGENPPTKAMQRMALPEGVLADGGQISGFLYFEKATNGEDRLVFRADMEDATNGQGVASIEIPFRVE
jgi:hypothetical protein